MTRKSTTVVSTKISPEQHESMGIRIKSLYESGLIRNCTMSSYLKGLIESDLCNFRKSKYQNYLKIIDSIGTIDSLPQVKYDNTQGTIYDDDFWEYLLLYSY
jgi:hypothetical protein